MTTRVQWRQGDVLFERVATVPDEATARAGAVLFQGERSGHAHAIAPPAGAEVLEAGDVLYVRAPAAFTVVHDEHGPIAFEPGTYRVWRQREYDPRRAASRDWSSVRD
jgi:hypothetical protein